MFLVTLCCCFHFSEHANSVVQQPRADCQPSAPHHSQMCVRIFVCKYVYQNLYLLTIPTCLHILTCLFVANKIQNYFRAPQQRIAIIVSAGILICGNSSL